MTTFDGAGVRAGPPLPPLPVPPPPDRNGSWPFMRPNVTTPMTTRAISATAGPMYGRAGPMPYGSRGAAARRVARAFPHPRSRWAQSAGAGPATTCQDRGSLGVGTGRGHVADLELERLEAAERAADEPADDVDPVALGDGRGQVGPAEGDPVEHVELALERQLGVPARRLAAASHGQTQHRDERLRVADAARRESRARPRWRA